jgi:hypothetical protein
LLPGSAGLRTGEFAVVAATVARALCARFSVGALAVDFAVGVFCFADFVVGAFAVAADLYFLPLRSVPSPPSLTAFFPRSFAVVFHYNYAEG